jgi:hypothetical protein
MEKPSYFMFARSMLNAVRKLIQILTSWLVITLKRNNQVLVLVLKHLMLPSRGQWRGHFWVFHVKVITSQNIRICVNRSTALSIALASIECEGFSSTHIFIFYPFIASYPVSYHSYFMIPYRLSIRNSVTWLCIVLTLLSHFWDNSVMIHNTVEAPLSLYISFCVSVINMIWLIFTAKLCCSV